MNEPVMSCVNCGLPVNSPFCAACGQPNPPKKLGLRTLWMDLLSRIYGLDGMFPRSIKDLTIMPGFVAKEFVKGNRKKYYGPVGYFFLMITVLIVLISFMDFEFSDFLRAHAGNMAQHPKSGSGQEQLIIKMLQYISDNFRIFSFLIIPFLAFTGNLSFRKSGYNYVEHAVLPFYVQGHFIWITILSVLVYNFFDFTINQIVSVFFIILFYCYACVGFYTHQSRLKVAIKAFFAYILAYLFFFIMFVLCIFFYVLSNPELMNLIKPSNNR